MAGRGRRAERPTKVDSDDSAADIDDPQAGVDRVNKMLEATWMRLDATKATRMQQRQPKGSVESNEAKGKARRKESAMYRRNVCIYRTRGLCSLCAL